MAICNEILTRYEKEKSKGKTVRQARVWTTQLGKGTSSAPCFGYLNNNSLVDIFLTNCDAYADKREYLKIVHHEYTHYLHCYYAGNKNKFYNEVISSEINSSITYFIDKIINSTSSLPFYDFSNQYVLFTENLAEWYSYVGLKDGAYGENLLPYLQTRIDVYDCKFCFYYLVKNGIVTSEEIINIIDTYNITTFQEFYDSLIKAYPSKKNKIIKIFKTYYVAHGNEIIY